MAAAAGSASPQLTTPQPTTRLLLLPLQAQPPADSAASTALMDAVRERAGAAARYKAYVVPKAKLCEALKASDFTCDVLLDPSQASLLARFLNVNAYNTGTFERAGGTMTARVRIVDIGSSGYAFLITASTANPGTTAALAEQISQRLNAIIRAGELARECNDRRQKGQLSQALESARKALQIEPNLTAAHLCIGTIYEAQCRPTARCSATRASSRPRSGRRRRSRTRSGSCSSAAPRPGTSRSRRPSGRRSAPRMS